VKKKEKKRKKGNIVAVAYCKTRSERVIVFLKYKLVTVVDHIS
jgi:hypothetical protein